MPNWGGANITTFIGDKYEKLAEHFPYLSADQFADGLNAALVRARAEYES